MRETDEQAIERERSEFTEAALGRFRDVCAAGGAVPAALVAVSPTPGGQWMLHVSTITDGPVVEVDVLRMLGYYIGDLIANLRAEQAEEAKGKKGGGR